MIRSGIFECSCVQFQDRLAVDIQEKKVVAFYDIRR